MITKWITISAPVLGGSCVIFWVANEPNPLMGLLTTVGVVAVLLSVLGIFRHRVIGGDNGE